MHASTTVTEDGVEWERYPIYAPSGTGVPQQHLVKFLSQLPTVVSKPTDPPLPPNAPPRLLYPFSSATRLCTPRHIDYRSKFINRKKMMKSASTQATAATAAKAAGIKEAEDEGVDPTERKWRLEDPKQAKENNFTYLGSHEPPPRKEIHQNSLPNHYAMLVRQEGKFLLVPMESYAFRHTDNDDKMTLEEAEQKMKLRVKRFEKRVKNMATLQAAQDEEDAAAGLATSAGLVSGGGGATAGGMSLARARPTATTKQQSERVEKADDAFADAPTGKSNRAGVLARQAKAKREEGADYVRQFDDDDVDGNDDRLDGQGGEASERESDDEEALVAEQQQAESEAAAVERKKQAALQKKQGMSIDEAEEEAEWAEAAAEQADEDEDESSGGGGNTTTPGKKDSTAKRIKQQAREEESEDEFDDSDLSLDDEDEEDGGERQVKDESKDSTGDIIMRSADGSSAIAAGFATPVNARKRPASPATSAIGGTQKKVKTESGLAAAAASTSVTPTAGTPATVAAAAPPSPAEIAELERLVIRELLAAAPGQPYTSKTLAVHLNKKLPAQFNKRTAGALRDVLRKVVSILPDKTHIILKKDYQQPK